VFHPKINYYHPYERLEPKIIGGSEQGSVSSFALSTNSDFEHGRIVSPTKRGDNSFKV